MIDVPIGNIVISTQIVKEAFPHTKGNLSGVPQDDCKAFAYQCLAVLELVSGYIFQLLFSTYQNLSRRRAVTLQII